MRREIRITGFGGQGIILAGYVLGKAAAIYDKKHATMVQSYGPEARGSACASQVVMQDRKILYPFLRIQEVLIAMSQEGYNAFKDILEPDGILLYDEQLVEPGDLPVARHIAAIPATRIAEKLGRTMVANIVMLGFVAAQTDIVSPEAMKQAILTSVPKGTEELNSRAFHAGFHYGREPQEEALSMHASPGDAGS